MSDRPLKEGYPSNQHKILVVEDNPDHMEIICDKLSDIGYQVVQARNGAQALETYQSAIPDLIILDALLPGMDGFETCQNIRSLPGGEHVPVIFMTSLETEEAIDRAFEVGAIDYVVKPIQWSVLEGGASKCIEISPGRTELPSLGRDKSATDGILSVDQQGFIRYANPAVGELFGYSVTDLVGQELSILMPAEFRGKHHGGIQRYLDTRKPRRIGRTVEMRGLRKSGDEFPMELSLSATEIDWRNQFYRDHP